MHLPPAQPSNTVRRRLWQTQLTKMARKATLRIPDSVSVSVGETVKWAHYTRGLKLVKTVLEAYSVTITKDFLLDHSVRTKREDITKSEYDHNFVIPQMVMLKLESAIEGEK